MLKIMVKILIHFISTIFSNISKYVGKSFFNIKSAHLIDTDTGLNVFELIGKHGYGVERHNIQTKDGYILEMHRIHNSVKNEVQKQINSDKIPVLLMHGVMGSSADWVAGGPGRSLAYQLSDIGYDVWLGNTRGNVWSKKHEILDPENDKRHFWNFSVHEMGLYDVPAKIDYICNLTGHKQIYYIGYSHGAVAFLVMASEKPEYNSKIRLSIVMGPYTKSKNMYNPIFQFVAKHEQSFNLIHRWLDMYELFPQSKMYLKLSSLFDVHPLLQKIRSFCIFFAMGFDPEQHDPDLVSVIATHYPSGCSLRQVLHLLQCIKNDSFRQFDYNSAYKNIQNYGQPIPPDYNLKNITAPLSVNYAKNDWLLSVKDVERLMERLPNVVQNNKIAYDKFNHLDFIYARDVFALLWNDVIKIMQKY